MEGFVAEDKAQRGLGLVLDLANTRAPYINISVIVSEASLRRSWVS